MFQFRFDWKLSEFKIRLGVFLHRKLPSCSTLHKEVNLLLLIEIFFITVDEPGKGRMRIFPEL